MKVRIVRFDRIVPIGDITTNECTEEHVGPIEFDGQCVWIGLTVIPAARVTSMVVSEPRIACPYPQCADQTFQNARALAGHNYHVHENKKNKSK